MLVFKAINMINYKQDSYYPKKYSYANIQKKSGNIKFCRFSYVCYETFPYLRLAWAAASLAMGTRKGEQLT